MKELFDMIREVETNYYLAQKLEMIDEGLNLAHAADNEEWLFILTILKHDVLAKEGFRTAAEMVLLDSLDLFRADSKINFLVDYAGHYHEISEENKKYWSKEGDKVAKLVSDARMDFRMREDEKKCSNCESQNIKTIEQMVGKKCPNCKKGTIIEINTGCIA